MYISNSSILETYFDQDILKEIAFNSKTISKLPGGKKDFFYNLVLVPMLEVPENLSQDEVLLTDKFNGKIIYNNYFTFDVLYSLAQLFKNKKVIDVEKIPMEINIISILKGSDIGITYTDGSFKKATNEASYGIVKLLNESNSGTKDEFSDAKYTYKSLSDKVSNGTNNIGELTGIKVSIENFDDKNIQVIISDSEYGIKCFREWYYNWKNNDFKNYEKKPIANKDLILQTYQTMIDSKKNILFRWVKGHNEDIFNEICDELAKDALK
jgi:ribonuclease HI